MITIRKSEDRGHFNHEWLDTYHTFSFGDYRNTKFSGFRQLRVLNEDRIQADQGFGRHPHRDMEIITYIIDGALAHKDSLGHESVLRPGDVQRMTAGTGVTHSEFNHSKVEPVHILQIWIRPETGGMKPDYEEKNFPIDERLGAFRLIGSPDGREGSITIHQDVNLFTTSLEQGQETEHQPAPNRYGWLQVVRGSAELNGQNLKAGDGAALEAEATLRLVGTGEENEILLLDLA